MTDAKNMLPLTAICMVDPTLPVQLCGVTLPNGRQYLQKKVRSSAPEQPLTYKKKAVMNACSRHIWNDITTLCQTYYYTQNNN
jgi:hypothetical protein